MDEFKFELVFGKYKLKISSQDAFYIKLLINKSRFEHEWSELVDILYNWSNDSKINDTIFHITQEQLRWIMSNASSHIHIYIPSCN